MTRKNEGTIMKMGTNFDEGASSEEDILTKVGEESKKKLYGSKEEEVEYEYYSE